MSLSSAIRKAIVSDAETIALLGRTTFSEAHKGSTAIEDLETYLDSKFTLHTVAAELLNSINHFHLLEYEGKPAGYSKIIFNAPMRLLPENESICKMERLYISSKFYDKKLGYKLFQFNRQLCEQNNQTGMWLTVWVENERAINFYERAGFRIVGEIMFTVGNTQSPNYVMWLEF